MIEIPDGVDGAWGLGLGAAQVLAALVFLTFSVGAGLRRGRERDRAIAAEARAPSLAPGPVVLRGTVETLDARPAIEIHIEQLGRQYESKQGPRVSWTEKSRTTTARPFRLNLDDGTKVEVRPPKDVVLLEELETTGRPRGLLRTRRARLLAGESVSVSGVLSAPEGGRAGDGYRGRAADGWRLEMPSGAMISASHLAEASLRWSRFHWSWVAITVVALVASQLVLWDQLYDVALRGERRTAEVLSVDAYTSGVGRQQRTVFLVRGELDDGEVLSAEVATSAFTELEEGDRIAWRVVPGGGRHQIGADLQVNWFILFFVAAGSVTLVAAYVGHRRTTTRWWERSTLVEDEPGRLV